MKEAPERVPNRNPGSEIRRFTLDYHIRHFMVPLQPPRLCPICAPNVPRSPAGRDGKCAFELKSLRRAKKWQSSERGCLFLHISVSERFPDDSGDAVEGEISF